MWDTLHVTSLSSSLTTNYRGEQFLNVFYVSGDMLSCEFCQHNADWKCVDTCKKPLKIKQFFIRTYDGQSRHDNIRRLIHQQTMLMLI